MAGVIEYASALFLLSLEEGTLDTVKGDIAVLARVIESAPEYEKLLDTPSVSREEKAKLIDEAFSTLDYSVINLAKMLSDKKCVHLIPKISLSFEQMYNERMGIMTVTAITAVAMSEGQRDAMAKKLAKSTGKTIIIKNEVDRKILGGVQLRYDGKQIDASVKARLDAFSESLKNIVI